jgi:hypothetical protein
MRKVLRNVLTAAIVVVAPVSAQAATTISSGGAPVNVASDTYDFSGFYGPGIVDLDFSFFALSDIGATSAIVTLNFTGAVISGLEMNWAATDLTYVGGSGFSGSTLSEATDIGPISATSMGGSVSTVFTLPYLSQVLNVGLKVSSADGAAVGIIGQVKPVSIVPLPAALPLLFSAHGGLGLLGWRAKRRPHAGAGFTTA